MKKIVSFFLIIALSLTICACGTQKAEGKGYDSPEDALLAYAEALKSGSVSDIISTFAIETYVQNYDLSEFWDYLGAANPGSEFRLSSIDSYTSTINIIERKHAITSSLANMYAFVATGDELYYDIYTGVNFDGSPYNSPDELLDDLEMEDWLETLAEMEFDNDFIYLEDIIDSNDWLDTLEDDLDAKCDYLHCDEIVSLALEIELDGVDYCLCMDVGRYDDKWYNLNPLGTIGVVMGCPAFTGGIYFDE